MSRSTPPPTLPEEAFDDLPPRKSKPSRGGPLPPFWSVALTFFLALSVAGCLIGALIMLGGRSSQQEASQPVILITHAPLPTTALDGLVEPTATIEIGGTPQPQTDQGIQLSGPTLAPSATATPTPIAIDVGAQVIVISQGGINVRNAPGTGSAVVFTANNNQTFSVIGGPEVVDGLRWWQIRDITNGNSGWVAENDGLSDLIQVYVP